MATLGSHVVLDLARDVDLYLAHFDPPPQHVPLYKMKK